MTADELLAVAERVAILVDTAAPAAAAFEVLEAEGATPEQRTRARLRLAELLRRLAPDEALAQLEGLDGAEADRVRAHALLDQLAFGRAREVASRLPEGDAPALVVVRARIAYLTDRPRAIAMLGRVIDAVGTDPASIESRADSLSLRARWRAEAGHYADGADDFAALEGLARELGAFATAALAGMYRQLYGALSAGAGGARSVVEAIVAGLTDGVPHDPDKLGPIPLHVHALMVRFGGHDARPEAFQLALYQLAGLMETAGEFASAYATLHYSAMIAGKRFGGALAASLRSRLELMLDRLGPERARELRDAEEARAAAFLRRVRRD